MVKLEPQLLAYTTATAMQCLSHICNLSCSLQQHPILTPLNEARDQTPILTDTSQVLSLLSHKRNSRRPDLKTSELDQPKIRGWNPFFVGGWKLEFLLRSPLRSGCKVQRYKGNLPKIMPMEVGGTQQNPLGWAKPWGFDAVGGGN